MEVEGIQRTVSNILYYLSFIYVFQATEDDIREYFEAYGALQMIQLKTQDSGRSKGYAFIK